MRGRRARLLVILAIALGTDPAAPLPSQWVAVLLARADEVIQ
jgi:hypothetical protein